MTSLWPENSGVVCVLLMRHSIPFGFIFGNSLYWEQATVFEPEVWGWFRCSKDKITQATDICDSTCNYVKIKTRLTSTKLNFSFAGWQTNKFSADETFLSVQTRKLFAEEKEDDKDWTWRSTTIPGRVHVTPSPWLPRIREGVTMLDRPWRKRTLILGKTLFHLKHFKPALPFVASGSHCRR